MRSSGIAFVVAAIVATPALAEETLYLRYESVARSLATQVTEDASHRDLTVLQVANAQLLELGEAIMDLYGVRYSECATQYADFKTKIPTLASLTVDDIETKYHDGTDLPEAPPHCYLGRALVVHPAMNAVRLAAGNLSVEDVVAIEEESLEVASHVTMVAQRLSE